MRKHLLNSLCITLLSAFLFNTAWLGVYTGWLMVPSFIVLFYSFQRANRIGGLHYKQVLTLGFVWGLLVFSFHFHWLAQALMKHAACSALLTMLLLLPVITYFSLLTGVWFYAMRCVWSLGRWLLMPVGALFWYLVDCYGLVPFGMRMGYPFINPVLPLMHYKFCLMLLSFFVPPVAGLHDTTELLERLCFVPPVVNRARCHGEAWTRSPHAVVQRLQKQLAYNQVPNAVLVSPESTVLFSLCDYDELVKTLSPVNNDERMYFLGALQRNNGQLQQVAHCLQNGLIIKTYVKKILVPFAEQTPPAWQWLQGLRERLAPGYEECITDAEGMGQDQQFCAAGCCVQPAICLEFFERSSCALFSSPADVVMAFVNDSWYGSLFRDWLFLLAVLKSHKSGRLVVYIGHFGCYTIEPKNHTITLVRSCYASLHA